jgi:PAS domain S-box-containing protein
MERSLSQDIREEREELREAAEQTLNTIVDLNLDGTIKWVSPSWTDVVGTRFESVTGVPISDLIVSENKTVFTDVVESMKRDDTKSHRVRFAIHLGPLSKLRCSPGVCDGEEEEGDVEPEVADLEAQGIMVYDSVSGGESHVGDERKPVVVPPDFANHIMFRPCGCSDLGRSHRRFRSTYPQLSSTLLVPALKSLPASSLSLPKPKQTIPTGNPTHHHRCFAVFASGRSHRGGSRSTQTFASRNIAPRWMCKLHKRT